MRSPVGHFGLSDDAGKAVLRRHHLSLRDAISADIRIEASLALVERGSAYLEARASGATVAAYHPIRSEIDPRPLTADLSGARLCLPVVTEKTTIEFRELLRTGTLVPSGFGTVGPPGDAAVLEPDILLMPLSVFDAKGGRVGYGAGYYDRAIAKLRDAGRAPLLIGLAFDEQEADVVPQDDHDIALHAILTPTRLLETDQ